MVAIGDIHGCIKSLEALWQKLTPYANHQHIFVGDYIDRGPSSKSVVDFLIEKRKERECIFLRGNHEQMLIDALDSNGDRLNHWLMNGGDTTLNSYGGNTDHFNISKEHIQFYNSTKLYYDSKNYFFAHAGSPPYQTIEESIQSENYADYFIWGRDHLNVLETCWEKTVIFGHTPQPEPILRKNMIGIDTGCVYERSDLRKLTAVILPDEKFLQQKKLD